MISIPLIVLYSSEAIACIAGFIYWRKVKDSYFKWFAIYLLYIFIADLIGPFFYMFGINNDGYYDYFVIPVEMLFFFWLFHATFRHNQYKRLPLICVGVYLSSLFVDVLYFAKHQFPFYSFSYSIGNLLLLILILMYFIQLINSDAILAYRRNMMFWICVGLLIYFLGTFPYYGLRNTFVSKYHKIHIIYNYITLFLDCIMYLMFTFSFIWGKPNLRSSQ